MGICTKGRWGKNRGKNVTLELLCQHHVGPVFPKRAMTYMPVWDGQAITCVFSISLCSSLAWHGGQGTKNHLTLTWEITRVNQHRWTQPMERVTCLKVQIWAIRRRKVGAWLWTSTFMCMWIHSQDLTHRPSKTHERSPIVVTEVSDLYLWGYQL